LLKNGGFSTGVCSSLRLVASQFLVDRGAEEDVCMFELISGADSVHSMEVEYSDIVYPALARMSRGHGMKNVGWCFYTNN